jgi:hypothetical protein
MPQCASAGDRSLSSFPGVTIFRNDPPSGQRYREPREAAPGAFEFRISQSRLMREA